MERRSIFNMAIQNIKSDRDHIVQALIELGVVKGVKGVTPQEIGHLKAKFDVDVNDELFNYYLKDCFKDGPSKEGPYVQVLKPEYFFSYLDSIELKEARKNASEACIFSVIAVFLSLIAVIWGIFGTVDLSSETIRAIADAIDR